MKITYYKQSDLLYIEFTNQAVETDAPVGKWSSVSLDAKGGVQSIEILHASKYGISINDMQIEIIEAETAPPIGD
ncbi:MAG: DUF2283 domain-containing protein [Chloroflexi bacterium]|nr:DUF2283 domain-containing protein [Chloroflexota bacterium]MCC6892991.1 DUF2283 domain-containing protein [Anaerolineae bacterium]